MDLPDTRLWRDDPRPKAGSPLIVIPIAPSVPSCSELSRYGLANKLPAARPVRTANLDSSYARRRERIADRDEETVCQIEQRNRGKKVHDPVRASWIIPRRTRAFPARASPFCRRLLPLNAGAFTDEAL